MAFGPPLVNAGGSSHDRDAQSDGSHFLGLRQGRAGGYEIVYEAAKTGKRLIWQIKNSLVSEGDITRQFEQALEASAVLETLCAGLRSAGIAFEVDVAL